MSQMPVPILDNSYVSATQLSFLILVSTTLVRMKEMKKKVFTFGTDIFLDSRMN